jgi:hypothetical protein
MGKNKQQAATEARTRKATPEVAVRQMLRRLLLLLLPNRMQRSLS